MTQVIARATIAAPIDTVFAALTNSDHIERIDPEVLGTTFLTDQKEGVGTRFKQLRRGPGGKEMPFEIEVAEWAPPSRARMVNHTHGTRWDTLYTLDAMGDAVDVALIMDATTDAFFGRLRNGLFKGLFRRGMQKHLDAVKVWCESEKDR